MTVAINTNTTAPSRPDAVPADLGLQSAPRPAALTWLYAVARALIAFGFLLRIARYLANRSLWLDEVLLARNILDRSFFGLLAPLDLNQGAPVGFLMLQKLAVSALGGSEYALRFVPLLAGIISLPLFWF